MRDCRSEFEANQVMIPVSLRANEWAKPSICKCPAKVSILRRILRALGF